MWPSFNKIIKSFLNIIILENVTVAYFKKNMWWGIEQQILMITGLIISKL